MEKVAQVRPRGSKFVSAAEALRVNWPLYLMEGAELGIFMVSACVFDVLIFHPGWALAGWNPWVQRLLMGASMGATAVLIIKSPWGKKSGAQFNPAITATFYRLGKIGPYDACWYCVAHFIGGAVGVGVARALLGPVLASGWARYVVTVPGVGGVAGAFGAELFMAALLMSVVLATSASERWKGSTTYLMGLLITSYVVFFGAGERVQHQPGAHGFVLDLGPGLDGGVGLLCGSAVRDAWCGGGICTDGAGTRGAGGGSSLAAASSPGAAGCSGRAGLRRIELGWDRIVPGGPTHRKGAINGTRIVGEIPAPPE